MEGLTVEIGGLKVVRFEPEGPPRHHPLLFVHGMWGGTWIWRNYLRFFSSRGYDCYAPALRGREGSKPVPDIGKVSFYEYLDDARAVAEAVGNPVLVGYSMGGLVVLKLAESRQPPATVTLAPAAPRGVFALATTDLAKAAVKYSPRILMRRPLMLTKDDMSRLDLNALPPEEQESVYGKMVPDSVRTMFEMALSDIPVDPAKLHCPVLVTAGSRDNFTPPGVLRKVAKRCHTDLREYAGFAHLMHMEPGWERVARDIDFWLADALRGSGPGRVP